MKWVSQASIQQAKVWVARRISAAWIGRVLQSVFRGAIPNHGVMLNVRRLGLPPALVAQVFWRLYEDDEIVFVRRYVRPAEWTIELGTSRGVVTSHLVELMGRDSSLVTVEADAELCGVVQGGLAGTCGRGTVHHYNAAITGDHGSSARFYRGHASETGSTMCVGQEGWDVPATTLSALKQRYGISEYDLVSDIEGAEAHFIVGNDRAALSGCRQMVIELHRCCIGGRWYEVDDLLEALVSYHGFRLLERRGPVVALTKTVMLVGGDRGASGTSRTP